jgi:hypothetical protein
MIIVLKLYLNNYKTMEYNFDNGLGASLIDTGYGGGHGLWELALLKDGDLAYNKDLGFVDVIGWLTLEEAKEKLREIESFKPSAETKFSTSVLYDDMFG